jgi:metallophosphoesterase (TIGR00282 family)
MNILFVGDVIGSAGRRALQDRLESVIDRKAIDFTAVNIENVAGGFGVTLEIFRELQKMPIDVFTSGNHIWDKKEFIPHLDDFDNLLRPANYPPGNPGKGWCVRETASGIPVGVMNLIGQVYLPAVDSPFRKADELLSLPGVPKVVLVDFHAEVTSEKNALGCYLDGRVSAVVGTHTHIPTADERILPGGTGYLTDVGGTGGYEGVIGFKKEKVLERFLTQVPKSFEAATKDVRLSCVVFSIDETTGKTTAVERFQVKVA